MTLKRKFSKPHKQHSLGLRMQVASLLFTSKINDNGIFVIKIISALKYITVMCMLFFFQVFEMSNYLPTTHYSISSRSTIISSERCLEDINIEKIINICFRKLFSNEIFFKHPSNLYVS